MTELKVKKRRKTSQCITFRIDLKRNKQFNQFLAANPMCSKANVLRRLLFDFLSLQEISEN